MVYYALHDTSQYASLYGGNKPQGFLHSSNSAKVMGYRVIIEVLFSYNLFGQIAAQTSSTLRPVLPDLGVQWFPMVPNIENYVLRGQYIAVHYPLVI